MIITMFVHEADKSDSMSKVHVPMLSQGGNTNKIHKSMLRGECESAFEIRSR